MTRVNLRTRKRADAISQTKRPYLEHNQRYIDDINAFITKCAIPNFNHCQLAKYLPFTRQFYVALMGGREKFNDNQYKAICKGLMKMRADKLREGR